MNFLITGGASGLGIAITKALARQFPESRVYFTYFSSSDSKIQLESELKNTQGLWCDFSSGDGLGEVLDLIQDNSIDVLINNALTGLAKQYFHKLDENDIISSFTSDVISTLKVTQAFITSARKRKSGKIITVLSAAIAQIPPTGWSVYIANKNYLLSMHKSWAVENKNFNITSNCISPDFMVTSLNEDVDERLVESMTIKHPLKKLLSVEEVAQTILFLCSSSPHLNGQNIVVNAAQF